MCKLRPDVVLRSPSVGALLQLVVNKAPGLIGRKASRGDQARVVRGRLVRGQLVQVGQAHIVGGQRARVVLSVWAGVWLKIAFFVGLVSLSAPSSLASSACSWCMACLWAVSAGMESMGLPASRASGT